MVSVERYKAALSELAKEDSKLVQNGFAMLKANYRSPGRLISATRLSLAADESYTAYGTANIQYGYFARRIAELMDHTPDVVVDGDLRWTYTLCDAHADKDRDGHFQWILRPEVATAMEQLGLVTKTNDADAWDDLQAAEADVLALPIKDRIAYQKARIGQGRFRDSLISYWGGCAVTGCKALEILIASHMKPWRDCDFYEATTMPNGLLLLPNLDAAFDKGVITFEDDGQIRLSPQLKSSTSEILGIKGNMRLVKELTDYHLPYLQHHRAKVFRAKP